MNTTTHPFFIEDGESRQETAILLVGTAEEAGIDQRDVRATRGGFRITQAVADALGLDTSEDADSEPIDPATVSGNDAEPDADADADADDAEPETVDYSEWDYADLKAEVAKRDLDTEDRKSDTLVAALTADDLNNASGNRAEKNTAEQE
jgi:hypothetical protein